MNQVLSIFLALAILLQSSSNLLILAGYELNKESITKNFCINKSKPKMHCNGKCHLQKQLKEQEKKDQSPTSSGKEKQKTLHFFQIDYTFLPIRYAKIKYILHLDPNLIKILFPIFHPPNSAF